MLTYGFAFGVILGVVAPIGTESGIQNFAFYLLSGTLPWGFYNMVTSTSMTSLIGNSNLVRKVSFPRENLVIAQAIFGFTQFVIEIAVLALVMSFAGVVVIPLIPLAIYMMLMLAAFSTGIGLVLAPLSVYFRDLNYLWQVVTQMYFFLIPIIYNEESLEGRVPSWVMTFVEWNPMALYVRGFRHAFYDGEAPSFGKIGMMAGYALISLTIGFVDFGRLNRRVAEEI